MEHFIDEVFKAPDSISVHTHTQYLFENHFHTMKHDLLEFEFIEQNLSLYFASF